MSNTTKNIVLIIVISLFIIIGVAIGGFLLFGTPIIMIDSGQLLTTILGIFIASFLIYSVQRELEEKDMKREKIYIPLYDKLNDIIANIEKCENLGNVGNYISDFRKDKYHIFLSKKMWDKLTELFRNDMTNFGSQLYKIKLLIQDKIIEDFNTHGIEHSKGKKILESLERWKFINSLLKEKKDKWGVESIFDLNFKEQKTGTYNFVDIDDFYKYFLNLINTEDVKKLRDKRLDILEKLKTFNSNIEDGIRNVFKIN